MNAVNRINHANDAVRIRSPHPTGGNPDMVDQAFNLLKEAGLPIPHIRRKKYVSSR